MTLARTQRRLLQAAAVLMFLVLAGATSQGVATALERREFPHPGRMVDVGGHQLHLYCTGEGTPTVILEAPAAGLSAAWGWIQPEIAETTRVCSYDRAGLGWSEAGDRPFDPAQVPVQLRALLEAAQERGPYVIAGQGLGAALARLAPATLAAGEGRATFAVNRRNNREADVPDLLAKGVPLKGPVDHTVPVMTVTRADGNMMAVLFGYACHPTTLSFNKWCGDYPGFAQLGARRRLSRGRGAVLGRLRRRPEPAAAPQRRAGRANTANNSPGPFAPSSAAP